MAGVMDSVNQLTELVGQNRMELLLFRLSGLNQRYGINVFKVREVLACPRLTVMPKLHQYVIGIAHIRGQTLSVIDLAYAIGGRPTQDVQNHFIIIAEYNRSTHAFLVSSVERILNMNWNKIMPPPKGAGHSNYMTAVTEIDNELVEILDVETLGCHLMAYLGTNYPEALKTGYKLPALPERADGEEDVAWGYRLLEAAGKKRGFLISGGEVDTERMAKILLDEYRSGKLGRFTLEVPEGTEQPTTSE